MKRNQDNNAPTNQEHIQEIKLVRHKWPDEIEAEKKQRGRHFFVLILIIIAFFIGGLFGRIISFNPYQNLGSSDKFDAIRKIMNSDWYFGKDIEDLNQQLLDYALEGMTSFSIDPHTEYLSVDEMAQWATSLSDNFVGIGVQLYLIDDQAIIHRVFKDSPAEKAGVHSGDIIISVDGLSVAGKSLDEIATLVKGENQTDVTMGFLRLGEPISITITRGPITSSAYGELLANGIGYIELLQFGEGTPKEFEKYLNHFAENKVDNLILDLRDNGGGYLSSVEKIASYFLPVGEVILIREDKAGTKHLSKASEGPKFDFNKIIVLTSPRTASASEVLAAALRVQINAILIGEETYGKGTVQITRNFADGSALKFTIEEWKAPDESKINNVGLTPDYEVLLPEILNYSNLMMDPEAHYKYDSVAEPVRIVQMSLKFLGYDINRVDGYFDSKTKTAIEKFQNDSGIIVTGEIEKSLFDLINSKVIRAWYLHRADYDLQFKKALEVIKDG